MFNYYIARLNAVDVPEQDAGSVDGLLYPQAGPAMMSLAEAPHYITILDSLGPYGWV